MARSSVNPHAMDEVKLQNENLQREWDRAAALHEDARQRVDSLAKSAFVLSGGALTISLGLFLRKEAPAVTPDVLALLQWAWGLLFISTCGFVLTVFSLIVQGYRTAAVRFAAVETRSAFSFSRWDLSGHPILNWTLGIGAVAALLVGLALLAWVAISVVGEMNATVSPPSKRSAIPVQGPAPPEDKNPSRAPKTPVLDDKTAGPGSVPPRP